MKHSLLILISFLLLSSPVIGNSHKGETLYRWGDCDIKYELDNSSILTYKETLSLITTQEIVRSVFVCDYKWMGFGEKDTHPKYKGEVKNGVPNGFGFLIRTDGGKDVGEWKNGRENGKGTETNSFGYKFEGIWKDGSFWDGVSYDPNGDIYLIYENIYM